MLFVAFFLLFAMEAGAQNNVPSDHEANRTTIKLYRNLRKLGGRGYLVGHQDDLAYGVNWKYQDGNSDIKQVTGDYPALYGWELGGLEAGDSVNLDGVPFWKMKDYIKKGYRKGGVITISWHGSNPMTGKTAWDPAEGTVASILPGGSKHEVFKMQLDKIAAFLSDLKDSKGNDIPVLFRPFHELSGGWFWWGVKYTSADEYKRLFRFTVNYLQAKGLHHLLYVYNMGGGFKSPGEFLERYPGDDVVDVLSFDTYQFKNPQSDFVPELSSNVAIVERIAAEKGKIAAVAEMGFSQIPDSLWWTGTVAPALKGHKLSYVLFWRNAGNKPDHTREYYVPYPGHPSEKDFIKFYKLPETFFGKDVARIKLYRD